MRRRSGADVTEYTIVFSHRSAPTFAGGAGFEGLAVGCVLSDTGQIAKRNPRQFQKKKIIRKRPSWQGLQAEGRRSSHPTNCALLNA